MEVHAEEIFRHGFFNADPHPGNIMLVRSRRPAVLRSLHAVDATRVRQTRSWVVSFFILRPFGPSRETTMLWRATRRVDGVFMRPHRLDAVDVVVRESTRRVSERRQYRDGAVPRRSVPT